eukprot:Hpha_TRINITY_DN6783_c0_g1::TRINITY_DN6783_c0_g1_i1::g.110943::m.110943
MSGGWKWKAVESAVETAGFLAGRRLLHRYFVRIRIFTTAAKLLREWSPRLQELEARVKMLTRTLEISKMDLSEASRRADEATDQLQEADDDFSDVLKQKERLESANADLSKRLKDSEDMLERSATGGREREELLKKENNRLREGLTKTAEEAARNIAAGNQREEQLKKENDRLRGTLQTANEAADDAMRTISGGQERELQLRKDNERLRENLRKGDQARTEAAEEASRNVARWQERDLKLSAENDRLRESLKRATETVDEVEKRERSTDEQLRTLQQQFAEEVGAAREMRREADLLRDEVQKSPRASEHHSLRRSAEDAARQASEALSRLQSASANAARAEGELAEVRRRCAELSAERDAQREKAEGALKDSAVLEERHKADKTALRRLEERTESLTEELNKTEGRSRVQEARLKAAEEALDRSEEERRRLCEELHDAIETNKALEARLKSAEEKEQSQEARLKAASEKEQALDRSEEERRRLCDELHEAVGRNRALTADFEKLKREVSKDKEALKAAESVRSRELPGLSTSRDLPMGGPVGGRRGVHTDVYSEHPVDRAEDAEKQSEIDRLKREIQGWQELRGIQDELQRLRAASPPQSGDGNWRSQSSASRQPRDGSRGRSRDLPQPVRRRRREYPDLGLALSDTLPRPLKDGSGACFPRRRPDGIRVVGVRGPAYTAGVKPNDLVRAVKGQPVSALSEFRRLVCSLPLDSKVELELLRSPEDADGGWQPPFRLSVVVLSGRSPDPPGLQFQRRVWMHTHSGPQVDLDRLSQPKGRSPHASPSASPQRAGRTPSHSCSPRRRSAPQVGSRWSWSDQSPNRGRGAQEAIAAAAAALVAYRDASPLRRGSPPLHPRNVMLSAPRQSRSPRDGTTARGTPPLPPQSDAIRARLDTHPPPPAGALDARDDIRPRRSPQRSPISSSHSSPPRRGKGEWKWAEREGSVSPTE